MNPLTVITGDCRTALRELPEASVHMACTSPPYDDLRTYGRGDALEWGFEETAKELYRVLVPGGVLCWNVGDSVVGGSETLTSFRQAIHFKDVVGFNVHDTMIWHKPNFANPEKVRYHQLFEYVFILTKGKPATFNPIKDKPNKYPNGPWGKNTARKRNGEMVERAFKPAAAFGMRGNVWKGNTVGQESPMQVKHPAMMPKWLATDLIRSWSNPGDIVLDPFAGSGTTGVAALEQSRCAILIELNPEYVKLIHDRCNVTQGLPL